MPQRDNKKKAIKRLTENEQDGNPTLAKQRFTMYANIEAKPAPLSDSDGLNIEAEYNYVEAIEYASAGQIRAIEKFIDEGGDVNEMNEFGTTAAIIAASRNDLSMLKVLVEKGQADLTVKDASGKSAMDWAITFKNESMEDYISAHSQDPPRYV